MNKRLNEHEIPAVTMSTKPGVPFFLKKSAYFVVTKENMLFSLFGYYEHNREAIKILFK